MYVNIFSPHIYSTFAVVDNPMDNKLEYRDDNHEIER